MRWVWYGAVPSSLRTAVRVLLSVLFPAALCAIFSGCHRSVDVSTMCDVPPGGGSAPVSVCYDNTDTTALYTLSFAVRHNGVAGGELRADVMFTAPEGTMINTEPDAAGLEEAAPDSVNGVVAGAVDETKVEETRW